MGQKVLEYQYGNGTHELLFQCPGCGYPHCVRVDGPGAWGWNKSKEKPTFTPSVLADRGTDRQCHSFVKDGNIQYLNDCKHALAGQTVEIPDWDEARVELRQSHLDEGADE